MSYFGASITRSQYTSYCWEQPYSYSLNGWPGFHIWKFFSKEMLLAYGNKLVVNVFFKDLSRLLILAVIELCMTSACLQCLLCFKM